MTIYRGYKIEKHDEQFEIYDPSGKMISSQSSEERALRWIDDAKRQRPLKSHWEQHGGGKI